MKTRPKLRAIDKRTARITVTLTRVEAELVRSCARLQGVTASEYLRRLALKAS